MLNQQYFSSSYCHSYSPPPPSSSGITLEPLVDVRLFRNCPPLFSILLHMFPVLTLMSFTSSSTDPSHLNLSFLTHRVPSDLSTMSVLQGSCSCNLNSYPTQFSLPIFITQTTECLCGSGSSICIATREWTVRGSNPGRARFFAVQNGPRAHPASCKMGTVSFPRVESGRGVTLTPHPLLVPRSKNRVQLYLYSP